MGVCSECRHQSCPGAICRQNYKPRRQGGVDRDSGGFGFRAAASFWGYYYHADRLTGCAVTNFHSYLCRWQQAAK